MSEQKPIFTFGSNAIKGMQRCPYSGAFIATNPSRINEMEAQYLKLSQMNDEVTKKLEMLNAIPVEELQKLVAKTKKGS